MKKEHKHETLGEKFFDWWDYADFGELVVGLIVSLIVIGLISFIVFLCVKTHEGIKALSTLVPDSPMDGVGRVQTEEAEAHLAGEKAYEDLTAHRIDTYTEWEGTAPHWYRPWEEMSAEWEASCQQVVEANNEAVSVDYVITSGENLQVTEAEAHAPVGIDPGGIDWNICTSIVGWDGHMMEVWEMDLFSRIVYLEFWGTSRECVEAGIDSMLLLWDMGEYGRTMGELLSAQYAPGYYVYSPYAYVWDWDYDAEGLADMRTLCEERFANGPEWCAPYFRLWYYHDWAVPAYQIDGVYFSVPRG